MNQEELERFYLAKARKADGLARITREHDARERWLLLAEDIGHWREVDLVGRPQKVDYRPMQAR